jgi:TIR domain
MNYPASLNIYSRQDLAEDDLPRVERVFISHRNADKPLAACVADVLDAVGVHYWFDASNEDVHQAATLGLAGDQALVHAIERGVKHCTRTLGLLSESTRGSWWVPYEIGFSRSAGTPVSFLVLESVRAMDTLPEYVRLAANYWSVDELVRWAASLAGGHVQSEAARLDPALVSRIERFVPRRPPLSTAAQLSEGALAAIAQLAETRTWDALRLTSGDQFDWLPTSGGLVRDLAYDLFAPLAFYQLNAQPAISAHKKLLGAVYKSATWHYRLAEMSPRLPYCPEERGWRHRRYVEPASCWLQGLSAEQLVL